MEHAVYRDDWGIPHLRADGIRQLAFAQGRNAATDRAWQIEVERHRAQGTTAAFLGPDAVAWDVFARRSLLTDTARRCFAGLDPDTRAWVCAYVDGVNTGLVHEASRAPEFAVAGLAPGRWRPWTPLAVWLSAHILFAGFPAKLWREKVTHLLGPEAVGLFAADGPHTSGSNGWLITADRTASGAPILAGDPHRFIEAPGVYQQIHLACPEFDVVGLAVPGVPGIAHFGHAGPVAWAITNAMADYQDLCREHLRRRGPAVEALGPHGWEPATARTETVEVAGAEPVTVEITETGRGPVVIGGPDDAVAVSLRCPPRVTGDLGFSALPALLRATCVGDVDRALDRWAEPVNVVMAADTAGGLLHRVAGRVPARPPKARSRVVAAWEPEYHWQGTDAPMPRAPAGAAAPDGLAVMANQRGLAAPLGVEFAPPYRAERIRELLETSRTWTAKGMAEIHMDSHLASARHLLDALARAGGLSPAAGTLRDRLLRWDRRMEAGSTDAGAYAALRSAVVRRLAAEPALACLADPGRLRLGGPEADTECPEVFRPWLAPAPRIAFALDRLLTSGAVPRLLPGLDRAAAVRAAAEEVAARETPPPAWGETHRLAPWQALPSGTPEAWPGLSGDHDCVLSTMSVPGVTDLSPRGPAARCVWDLAHRDDSRWVVPLGASGVPGDPHGRDQLPLWTRGELVPVVTDWERLTGERHHREDPDRPHGRGDTMSTADATNREPLHKRRVEGFGEVAVVPVDPARDIALIHHWVGQERARFWGMRELTREQVLEIYEFLDSLTTHHACLILRDGRPVALFQSYDPAADPVGEAYEVRAGDIGIHLFVGPADGPPEHGFTDTLLAVFLEFVLRDPARRRVVAEPDARNARAISRLTGLGFVPGPLVDLPEKRARLVFLDRDAAPPVHARRHGGAPRS
ncbi:hypothetical protein GCM10009716_17230 [Streptomyces sodiiphilus]|uniref:Lysine N-acyltransferase MbtK n=1 Tax=Streptomyces sodiiphilus TaxID=226217 RepID=A0ABP5A9L8_9ACTN